MVPSIYTRIDCIRHVSVHGERNATVDAHYHMHMEMTKVDVASSLRMIEGIEKHTSVKLQLYT